MSQRCLYELLRELGGTATVEELKRQIRVRDIAMYKNRNIYTLLRRLEVWQFVMWNAKKKSYTIIAPYPPTTIDKSPIVQEDLIE